MAQDEDKAVQHTIQRLMEALGEVTLFETEGPGVYYLAVKEYGELYIVEQASPIISDAAKSYGKRHPNYAGLLFYSLEDEKSGSKIVLYELEKYAVDSGIPDHDSHSLHTVAAYCVEIYPEYFGAYPAPVHTPWGYTLRYRCLKNGIFWLETDQRREALSICYPIWSADLSEYAVKLGAALEWDQKSGVHTALANLFFAKPDACIPVFELLQTYPELGETGRVSVPALMNTIWESHPYYVLAHNLRELLGINDPVNCLLNLLGIEISPNISADNMIALFPNAGTEYIAF